MSLPDDKDMWYHGNSAALKNRYFLGRAHRDKAYEADKRRVYRLENGVMTLVAVFESVHDAALVVDSHNHVIRESERIQFATDYYGFDASADPYDEACP